jgi:hypothetical protein
MSSTYAALDRVRPLVCWTAALAGIAVIALFSAGRKPRHGAAPFPTATDSGPLYFTIRADRPLGPISPYIYGMAQPAGAHFAQLRPSIWRWGGNPSSRYNWEKGNCWNAAADWEFRNGNYGNVSRADKLPSGVADKAIAAGKSAGWSAMITIPTLGWVARNDDTATASIGVPSAGGTPVSPGSDAIAGYDPAANRARVSQRSLPRKGRAFADPPDLTDDVVYQDEWVYHLKRKFGASGRGGVRYYAMDNEPDLWSATHRDMHPARPGYGELLKQFIDYAEAVKAVDPTALVTGPASWGWTGYFYSPLDEGSDKYATAADRKAHGGLPFLAWFLRQVAEHDRRTGRRTLDVLDVHFYPQAAGVYRGSTDDATNALRLRSTRALWDPDYEDESWIEARVNLIGRLRYWIDTYYPGTRIGLTEWNWGAENTLNGGVAAAEVLGILGRERVDLACYWTAPGVGSPAFFAWKMYRNADGSGGGFGDVALEVEGGDTTRASCFASVDSRSGYPVMIVLNKSATNASTIRLNVIGGKSAAVAHVYQYSGADTKAIHRLPDLPVVNGRAAFFAPPYSITLLSCQ